MIYQLAKDDNLSDESSSQDPCFLNESFINVFPKLQEVADEMCVFFNFVTYQSYSFSLFHI